jgi:hypothetical protein
MAAVTHPTPWDPSTSPSNAQRQGNAEASSSKSAVVPAASGFEGAVATTNTAPRVPDRPVGIADGTLATTGAGQ